MRISAKPMFIVPVLLLTACTSEQHMAPSVEGPAFIIADGAHGGGNEHFYFLPPMVPAPHFSGNFDGTLAPVVRITGPANFELALSPAVSFADEHYHVNWNTREPTLIDGAEYRITVLVDNIILGYADVKVSTKTSELKNVNTGEFIPLKDGRTLPITFRIEEGWNSPPTTRGWSSRAPLVTQRQSMAAASIGGKLIVLGGWDGTQVLGSGEVYDPLTNEWDGIPALPTPRMGLGVGVIGGLLYAVGGQTTQNNATVTGALEIFDPLASTWSEGAPMPTPRSFLGVAVVGGKLYAIGGQSSGWNAGTVEIYDPATDTWTSGASMPTPRQNLSLGAVGNKLYAVGGMIGDSPWVIGTVESYDPSANVWTSISSMPTPRWGLATATVGGKLYAVGGYGQSALAATESFDPVENAWSQEPDMPTSRRSLAAGEIAGVIYAVGGANTGFQVPTLAILEAFAP